MPRELSLYILIVIMAGALSLFLCLFELLKVKDAPGVKPYIILTILSSSTSLEQIIPVFLLLMCRIYRA